MTDYHYTECGLDNVFVHGMHTFIDDEGDEVISIRFVAALHHTIARAIVSKNSAMSGKELRFLRTEMGLSQAGLGELLHVEKLTVGRWEREESPIDDNAETVVKLLAKEKLVIPFDVSIEEMIKSHSDATVSDSIVVNATDEGYDLAA